VSKGKNDHEILGFRATSHIGITRGSAWAEMHARKRPLGIVTGQKVEMLWCFGTYALHAQSDKGV
jgi:hypothetical protein